MDCGVVRHFAERIGVSDPSVVGHKCNQSVTGSGILLLTADGESGDNRSGHGTSLSFVSFGISPEDLFHAVIFAFRADGTDEFGDLRHVIVGRSFRNKVTDGVFDGLRGAVVHIRCAPPYFNECGCCEITVFPAAVLAEDRRGVVLQVGVQRCRMALYTAVLFKEILPFRRRFGQRAAEVKCGRFHGKHGFEVFVDRLVGFFVERVELDELHPGTDRRFRIRTDTGDHDRRTAVRVHHGYRRFRVAETVVEVVPVEAVHTAVGMTGRAGFPVLIALRRVVPQGFAEPYDIRFRLFAEGQRGNAEIGRIHHGDVAGEIFGAVEFSFTEHEIADTFAGKLGSRADGVEDADLVGKFASPVFGGLEDAVQFRQRERDDLARTGCREVGAVFVKGDAPRRCRAESDVVEQDRVDVGVGFRVDDGEAVRVDPRAVKLGRGVLIPRDHGGDEQTASVGSRFDVLYTAGTVDEFDGAYGSVRRICHIDHIHGRADDLFVCRVIGEMAGNIELVLRDRRRHRFSADRNVVSSSVDQIDHRDGIRETVGHIRRSSDKFHIGRSMSDGVFLFEFEVGAQHGQRTVEAAAGDIDLAVMHLDAVRAAFKIDLRRDTAVGGEFDDPSAGFVRRVDRAVLCRIHGRGRYVIFRRDPRLQRGSHVLRSGFRLAAGSGHKQKSRREQQGKFRFHRFYFLH